MAKVLLLLFGIIVFQQCSYAAPSEPSENTNPVVAASDDEKTNPTIAPSDEGGPTLDSEPNEKKLRLPDTQAPQTQRQKRYYEFSELEYPPYDLTPNFAYPRQPHYTKRDGSRNTAVYGEDPLNIIFNKLHEIVLDARRHQYQAPRPVHNQQIPAYIPFLYIPQCGCNSNNHRPQRPLPPTFTDRPTNGMPTTTNNGMTFDNRGGFDDKNPTTVRSNDGTRPVSFETIPPKEPIDQPIPPVDHGTVQAGLEPQPDAEDSRKPDQISPNQNAQRLPETINLPEVALDAPANDAKNYRPSLCDGAIISCCTQSQVSEKCFNLYGCENPYVYGNPCDPKVQLSVISKFQNFHKRRAG